MPSVTAPCRHHYDIPPCDKTRGPILLGVCRLCGHVKPHLKNPPLRRSPEGFVQTIQYSKHHGA